MAREEKKRVELRTVDEEVVPVVEVVRLSNPETGQTPKDETPIRLGPSQAGEPPSRLDLPSREEIELRTHQPGVDALIETELIGPEFTEDSWGAGSKRRHPIPWGWFALIGLAIASALVWSLTRVEKADVQMEQIRQETESVLATEEFEEKEAQELIDRIEKAMRIFFSATTVDSMARLVRQPERVLPLMRRHYSRAPLQQSPLRSVRVLQPLTLENRTDFWMASVVLANGQVRNFVIEITPTGEPLMDWETLVCDQPMPWDEFARERPAGRSLDFRVYAEHDVFFSHEFADSGRWLCFRLTALDSEETLFGYAPVDSPEAQSMQQIIRENGGRRTSLILRLSIPEGLQSRRGVMIEKVLSPRWLYLDEPDPAS